jgi:hypothetical protein
VTTEEVQETATKIFAVIHPDDHDGAVTSLHTFAKEMVPWEQVLRTRFDDGSVYWLFAQSSPENGPDGSSFGMA